MPVKAGYLLLAAGGGVLVWSGLKGKSVSSVFRQLAGGDAPGNAKNANSITGSDTTAPFLGSSPTIPGVTVAPQPGVSASAGSNQALAQSLAPQWASGQEWQDWLALWNQESGWSATAENPQSGAYGIPQALPPTKLPAAGQKSGGSSPLAQEEWGIAYIEQRYGDPENAWAHEQQYSWY